MLYLPPKFKGDPALARELARRNPFATLVTVPEGQEPRFSHLPFVWRGEDRLVAHMARANPQRKDLAAGLPATIIFHGPHAYVSPRWYMPDTSNVPTWNYAVVHAFGRARMLAGDGADSEAMQAMHELIATFDPGWSPAMNDKERKELLQAIAPFEIQVERLEAKLKLSQNREDVNRRSVASELLRSAREYERETGALMMGLEPDGD